MTYHNILIVKLSAIGDVIHALPVSHALRQCFPQARITWVVEKPAYDLLTNNPDIDEIIIFDKPQFKSLAGLIRHAPPFITALRQKQFDLALDLQGLLKSSLISFFSGAQRRLVYQNAREGSRFISERVVGAYANGHVVDRYLDVVRALGCRVEKPVFPIRVTEQDARSAQAILKQAGAGGEIPYVVLALGANWPNKIWPPEHFAALADKLFARQIIPVAVGGPGDRKLLDRLNQTAEIPPVDLIGKTSLKQLAYVIQQAAAFVGGDTGPMHLSAALGTPTIALMGPTDVNRNGPLGQKNTALVAGRPCIGCWHRKCPTGLDCLAEISVEDVYQAIKKFV
ncbi:MAG: glycosyltransferase family 9 protein [Veillonellales bacterium]